MHSEYRSLALNLIWDFPLADGTVPALWQKGTLCRPNASDSATPFWGTFNRRICQVYERHRVNGLACRVFTDVIFKVAAVNEYFG